MPRERKQVARFDPSPSVAPWSHASSKVKTRGELQARIRHKLVDIHAVAAAPSASVAVNGEKAEEPETNRKPRASASGRKRQRTAGPKSTLVQGRTQQQYEYAFGGPISPPISNLLAGRLDTAAPANAASCGNPRLVTANFSVTDSSLSCSTSGSDSEYSFSYGSPIVLDQNHNMSWGGVAALSEEGGGAEGGALIAGASGGVSDTDSESCSDLLPTLRTSTSGSSSRECTSCSAGMTEVTDVEYLRTSDDCGPDCGVGAVEGDYLPKAETAEDKQGEGDPQHTRKIPRNVVTLRIARSQMPKRWETSRPAFKTCLDDVRTEDRLGGGVEDAGALFALMEEDGVDSKNWLCSGLIDVVMAKLARTYPNVHFMPIDFAVLCLNGWGSDPISCASSLPDEDGGRGGSQSMIFQDILGRPIIYSEKKPVIFFTHVSNVHWNLLRVEHEPVSELQLFEPMGKPPRRTGGSRGQPGAVGLGSSRGTGFRCIPKEVYRWLDTVWPLHSSASMPTGVSGAANPCSSSAAPSAGMKRKAPSASKDGWACRAYSAITSQQQTTGFDCGVASLLYAEKCGQGQMREDVDAWTTQGDMTEYRQALQRYFQEVLPDRHPSVEYPPVSPSGAGIADDVTVALASPSQAPSSLPPAYSLPPSSPQQLQLQLHQKPSSASLPATVVPWVCVGETGAAPCSPPAFLKGSQ